MCNTQYPEAKNERDRKIGKSRPIAINHARILIRKIHFFLGKAKDINNYALPPNLEVKKEVSRTDTAVD